MTAHIVCVCVCVCVWPGQRRRASVSGFTVLVLEVQAKAGDSQWLFQLAIGSTTAREALGNFDQVPRIQESLGGRDRLRSNGTSTEDSVRNVIAAEVDAHLQGMTTLVNGEVIDELVLGDVTPLRESIVLAPKEGECRGVEIDERKTVCRALSPNALSAAAWVGSLKIAL